MFEPLLTTTTDISLDAFVSKMVESGLVEGVILFGTTATGAVNDLSDYDVLVVLAEHPPPIRSGITWVSDRVTDLAFASKTEVRQLEGIDSSGPVSDGLTGDLRRWVTTGSIAFDRDGSLSQHKRRLGTLPSAADVSEAERFRRWDHTNYNLAHSARYASASDEIYQEAFDLRMSHQIADVMIDYFRVRRLRWPGEKDAIRYWNANDLTFKQILFACLREPDRRERLRLYSAAVAAALEPIGGIWPSRATSVTPSEGGTIDGAQRCWSALVGENADGGRLQQP